ncbi:Adenylate cyclase (EC [Olavius sp. associated proteobacterium Delta 1]|nr:Adenylate cyclase (EC [Olavius sp. associated proteobacterium Delta 1]
MRRPITQYAKSGEVHIAYQVTGSGPRDLIWVPGFVSHLDLMWDWPVYVHMFERLGSFSRLIRFDKRGTGMSDRVSIATLEERMDDVRSVMDAADSEKAAIFGVSEGGPMSLLFAATYPERTSALILYGAFAKRLWSPDYPIGVPELDRQAYLNLISQSWSGEADLSIVAPSFSNDIDVSERWAAYRRMCASPGAALDIGNRGRSSELRFTKLDLFDTCRTCLEKPA